MAINFPDSPSNGDTFTASGTVYVYSTANNYWSKQSSTIPLEVTGHVLPDTNITYDLGSSTKRFRDLYIDGNTLDLGGQEIKATASGIELSELTIGSGTNKVKLVATTTGKLETTGTDSGGTTAAATSSLNENSCIEDLSNVIKPIITEQRCRLNYIQNKIFYTWDDMMKTFEEFTILDRLPPPSIKNMIPIPYGRLQELVCIEQQKSEKFKIGDKVILPTTISSL